jgi:hypothetical protein
MTSAAALANSPKTFLDRDNWMRALLASTLDAAVRAGCANGARRCIIPPARLG